MSGETSVYRGGASLVACVGRRPREGDFDPSPEGSPPEASRFPTVSAAMTAASERLSHFGFAPVTENFANMPTLEAGAAAARRMSSLRLHVSLREAERCRQGW